MAHRYVPILRWQRGERVALSHLSKQGLTGTIPLIVLAPKQYVGKEAKKNHPAMPAAGVFIQEMKKLLGGAPFYVDAAALPVSPGTLHPIVQISQRAALSGLHLIPVMPFNAPSAYRNAVQTVVSKGSTGVGIRVDLQQFTAAASWVGSWPFLPADTDLIADFGDNVGNVLSLGHAVDHAFTNLHAGSKWRTVTVAGTSIPANFSGYTAGLHTLKRQECVLWTRLGESQTV